jgi:hypothetical protein
MINKKNKWFSLIIALLITAFLVVLSSWILTLVLQESKNTRLVFNTISTYAWAEWAIEYWLLKQKNHDEWFQDEIVDGVDSDSKLLHENLTSSDEKIPDIEYKMETFSKSYRWSVETWDFEIIPLFYDEWEMMQTNSKKSNKLTSSVPLKKTTSFRLKWDWDFVWNIIWNDAAWDTFWIVWSWTLAASIWFWFPVIEGNWIFKQVEADTNLWWNVKKLTLWNMSIWTFITTYNSNYLVLFNNTNNTLNYTLESNEGFALPKSKIVWSAKVWNFRQNLMFEESKNRYFESLKYSIFNN